MEKNSGTLKTRSCVSSRSGASSTTAAAAAARANAEAARARLKYAEKEIRMKMEKAQLEASMEMLSLEKEMAVAEAKAGVLEAAAANIEERHSCELSFISTPYDSSQRTKDYVKDQEKVCEERSLEVDPASQDQVELSNTEPPMVQAVDDTRPNTESNIHPASITHLRDVPRHAPKKQNPESSFHIRDGDLTPGQCSQPPHGVTFSGKDNQYRPSSPYRHPPRHSRDSNHTHISPTRIYSSQPTHAADSHMTDFVRFLARRELVTTGLLQFNDQPESYRAWRRSFLNAVRGLELSYNEEMDLLVKWLGKESAEHAKRIRSIHINQPASGLQMIWTRLDECYGSAEAIEKALFQKIDNFPKISNKDYPKLRDLSDLLMELNAAKAEGDLPGLSYLDTARGINPIVQKLPYSLQEKWLSHGSSYKLEHQVAFPPFSVFVAFLHQQARIRNDPSFILTGQTDSGKTEKPLRKPTWIKEVSVHKTEVSPSACSDQVRYRKKQDEPDKICPIHRKPHSLQRCRAFRMKPIEERRNFLKENGICFKCCTSTSHTARECECEVKCTECGSNRHLSALHPGLAPWVHEIEKPASELGGEPDPTQTSEVTTQCTEVCGGDLTDRGCSKILLAKVYPAGRHNEAMKVYVILDEQSNRSLARSEFFDTFSVQGPTASYSLKTCSGASENMGRTASSFFIESLDGGIVLPLPRLLECNAIPDNRAEIPTPSAALFHRHLKPIAHLIPELDPNVSIMLLLGRDIIRLHKVRKRINGPADAPYAQKLDLGWVIVGNVCLGRAHRPLKVNTFYTNALEKGRPTTFKPCPSVLDVKEQYGPNPPELTRPRDGTYLGHTVFQLTSNDNKLGPSVEDLTFMAVMEQGLKKDESNSWVAPLPFKQPRRRLPDNRPQALNRFFSLKRSLERKPEMSQHFFSFMGKIFENGHAEVAPPLKGNEERWYLPIFGVYHPKKPGSIRVVFDSSAQHDAVSLNDVLLTGPDLNNSLLGVLIRFRREAIAVTADIKQMFHCFLVREQDRNFLRFFWFRDNDPAQDVIEYRMTVHVFGNSPSPAVAIYCLRQSTREREPHEDPEVRQFVDRDFYVDDGLKSLPTAAGAISLLKRTQDILAMSNLRLHKIASNSKEVMDAFSPLDLASDLKDLDLGSDTPPVQRSLGLNWDLKSDTFTFKVDIDKKPFTRRGVLSVVNSVYDPLGFVAPVTIQGKHILRELTQEKGDWDSPLPEKMEEQWTSWRDSLKHLSNLHIPRPYTKVSLSVAKRRELSIFSDASLKAIAAVAYLTVVDELGNSHTGFVMGKAKLAPRPEHTIPRLELCAAVLAVELADLISSELDLQIDATTFYVDSKVVLGYIHNESRRFYVYVSNRVIRIRRSSQPQQWKYVPTEQNPADYATRSVTAARLADTTWLSGPSLLTEVPEESLEPSTFELVNPNMDVEVRPQISTLNTQTTVQQLGSQRFSKFSSWQSLNRAIANLSHISHSYCSDPGKGNHNCRGWHLCSEAHSVEQLSLSKCIIIRAVQEETYAEELACLRKGENVPQNSPLKALDPFIDGQNLLRVGGRIKEGKFKVEEKNPLIIPGKHYISTLLITHYHEQTQHQGRLFTEGAIRAAGYWVIGVKRRVSSIIHHCVICRKLRGNPGTQKMADLPADRLSMEPPFTNVGLDVFGPWEVEARKTRGGLAHSKRWAVIFTCMSVRAVHIEVIESLDTSSFINALRRFLAIRGPVKQIRSDRGTNFVSASAELKIPSNINRTSVERYLEENGCSWLFNPPHASHMGGSWERMIGMARRILDSMFLQLRPSKLTHEVLATLMAEVAAIINARPLIAVSADPSDPFILTPTTLLTQKTSVPSVPPDNSGVKDIFKHQWRQVQHLAQTFWSKWRKHYLSTLQPRRKWQNTQPNLEPGSVVLLKDQQLERNEWPLGIVTQVFPSKDGNVRKAEIKVARKTGTKLLLRPLSEIVLILPPT